MQFWRRTGKEAAIALARPDTSVGECPSRMRCERNALTIFLCLELAVCVNARMTRWNAWREQCLRYMGLA